MSAAKNITPKGARRFLFIFVLFSLAAIYYEADKVPALKTLDLPKLENTNIDLTSNKGLNLTKYKVVRVIDGDTIAITYNDIEEKVRLIGINTPETVDPRRPVQCFGKEATKEMKSLVSGKEVGLEFDDTQSLRDIYGRLLAYVYLPDGEMVNRKMLAEGYAYEYTYGKPYKYQKEFKSLQTLAENNKRGLWAPDTCAGELQNN